MNEMKFWIRAAIIVVINLPLWAIGQSLEEEQVLRGEGLDGSSFEEVVTSDGDAGFIFWLDTRGGSVFDDDLYAQKVTAAGSAPWDADGVPVCLADGSQEDGAVAPDGSGGAIAVWKDSRRDGGNGIYGQRISAEGNIQWAQNGIQLSGSDFGTQYQPHVHYISNGEFYLTYGEERDVAGPGDEYWLVVNRINGNGQRLWGNNGVAALEGVRLMNSALDGAGGVVVFGRIREGNDGFRFQRVMPNQSLAWGTPPEVLAELPNTPRFSYTGDGMGGIILAFNEGSDLRAVRIAGDGSMPWGSGGMVITDNVNDFEVPGVVTDGNGGAFIAWIEDELPDRLRIQRVNADGSKALGPDGKEVPEASFVFPGSISMTSDGTGGLYLAYEASGTPKAQRLDSAGEVQWITEDGYGFSLEDGFDPKIVPGGNGPITFMESGDGLVSRVVTDDTTGSGGLPIGVWSETEIGWVYGVSAEWGISDYMGDVFLGYLPYIYQVNLGWLYLFSSNRPDHYLYDYELGWLLTREDWEGFYYIYATNAYASFAAPQP